MSAQHLSTSASCPRLSFVATASFKQKIVQSVLSLDSDSWYPISFSTIGTRTLYLLLPFSSGPIRERYRPPRKCRMAQNRHSCTRFGATLPDHSRGTPRISRSMPAGPLCEVLRCLVCRSIDSHGVFLLHTFNLSPMLLYMHAALNQKSGTLEIRGLQTV